MTDIVERLRKKQGRWQFEADHGGRTGGVEDTLREAADEIEWLRGRIAELEGEKMDDWTTGRNDEIERLQAEVRRLMRILEVQII